MHVTHGDIICLVQLVCDPDILSRLGILFIHNVKQCQKLICFHICRMHLNCFLKLEYSQILTALVTVIQCLIVSFDRLIDLIQLVFFLFYLYNIIIGNVLFRLEILA